MALDDGVAGGVARSQLVRDACPREEAPGRSIWWQNRGRQAHMAETGAGSRSPAPAAYGRREGERRKGIRVVRDSFAIS